MDGFKKYWPEILKGLKERYIKFQTLEIYMLFIIQDLILRSKKLMHILVQQ